MITETELVLARALERAFSNDPEQRAEALRTLQIYHLNPNVTEYTLETSREVLIGNSSLRFTFQVPPGAMMTGVRVAIESVGESQEEILNDVLAGAGVDLLVDVHVGHYIRYAKQPPSVVNQAIIVARQGELVTVIVTQTCTRARRVRVEFLGRREG